MKTQFKIYPLLLI